MGSAISSCKVMVVLVSSASAHSPTCRDDVAYAFMSDKPVLPVLVGDAAVTEQLSFGTRLMPGPRMWCTATPCTFN